MAKFLVTYEVVSFEEEVVEADSFEEVQKKYENWICDEVLSIKNLETGEEIEF